MSYRKVFRGIFHAEERRDGGDHVGVMGHQGMYGWRTARRIEHPRRADLLLHKGRVVAEKSFLVEFFAVVARDDNDRVVHEALLGKCRDDAADLPVEVVGGIDGAVVNAWGVLG